MEKLQQTKETYDRIYADGGYQGVFDLPYQHSAYFPLFKRVLREVLCQNARSVLEVGCGSGAFAHLLMDSTALDYHGFDFSKTAVEKAIARTQRRDAFYIGDATESSAYEGRYYDCIVCTEVLEHVEKDLAAIANWRAGTLCICSVPNFDANTHVRFFGSADEVRARYRELIDIKDVARIKKPVLSDISMSNTLRAIRWNRYRPQRLMAILGIGAFETLGGWFVFSGIKR